MSDMYRVGFAFAATGNLNSLPKPYFILDSYIEEINKILNSCPDVKIRFHSRGIQQSLDVTQNDFLFHKFLAEFYGEQLVEFVKSFFIDCSANKYDHTSIFSFFAVAFDITDELALNRAIKQIMDELKQLFNTITIMDIKPISSTARILRTDKYWITFNTIINGGFESSQKLLGNKTVREITHGVGQVVAATNDIRTQLVRCWAKKLDDQQSRGKYKLCLQTLAANIADEAHLNFISKQLSEKISAFLNTISDIHIEFEYYETNVLIDDKNLGICCKCGTWVTDFSIPGNTGVFEGTIYKGDWYCELCLPLGHLKAVRLPD